MIVAALLDTSKNLFVASKVIPKVRPIVSLPAIAAADTISCPAINELVVLVEILKVPAVAEVLQIVIVEITVAVNAGTVYKVLAVAIVPLPAAAPRRLYVVATSCSYQEKGINSALII